MERIWNDYETEIDRIVKQQQDVAKKRMLPIMVGSLSGVASPLLATLVAVNTLYITVPVAAISFGLYFINYHKKDTSYEDRKAATERLTERYVCPNCHRFLGNISYKLLKNQIRSPKDQKCIVLDVDVSLLKMIMVQGLKIGTILQNGTYRIVKVLGQGSFGITYLAKAKLRTQGNLGSMNVEAQVAIKEFS